MRQFPPISKPDELAKHQQYMTIDGQKYGCFWIREQTGTIDIEDNVKDSYTKWEGITTYCRPHQSYGWKIKSVKL